MFPFHLSLKQFWGFQETGRKNRKLLLRDHRVFFWGNETIWELERGGSYTQFYGCPKYHWEKNNFQWTIECSVNFYSKWYRTKEFFLGLCPKIEAWVFCFLFFVFSETGFLCYSFDCPGTHSVEQSGVILRDSSASSSGGLGLRACAIAAQPRKWSLN